ncbi:hypothetical protein [Sphingomonas sp. Leaf4]|uniref:hypothetical protein n=1 Tax=Sphingomonas sp. Leaf4 TaxID=2876553 RepID=UPI001E3C4FB2|nr:hypothetical protein [Sphingomonas sp. Leaf4]
MTAREQGLKVELVDGRLVISIGIDALMTAVKGSPSWEQQIEDDRGWSIEQPDGFAADVVAELEREEEDGTTPVHRMLDEAFEQAIDQGSLHIDLGKDA